MLLFNSFEERSPCGYDRVRSDTGNEAHAKPNQTATNNRQKLSHPHHTDTYTRSARLRHTNTTHLFFFPCLNIMTIREMKNKVGCVINAKRTSRLEQVLNRHIYMKLKAKIIVT